MASLQGLRVPTPILERFWPGTLEPRAVPPTRTAPYEPDLVQAQSAAAGLDRAAAGGRSVRCVAVCRPIGRHGVDRRKAAPAARKYWIRPRDYPQGKTEKRLGWPRNGPTSCTWARRYPQGRNPEPRATGGRAKKKGLKTIQALDVGSGQLTMYRLVSRAYEHWRGLLRPYSVIILKTARALLIPT